MALTHEEKKEIIVEAAREVFGKFGYRKTTIEDISASLYRAKSSIYYYFKSKEDIFRAVLELETRRAKQAIYEAVDNATTPEDKLRAYFYTINSFIQETVSYYKLMQEEMIDILGFASEMKEKHEHEANQEIAIILKEGVDSGEFDIPDIPGTAEAIKHAFDVFTSPFYSTARPSDKQIDIMLNLILYGIKTR